MLYSHASLEKSLVNYGIGMSPLVFPLRKSV